MVEKSPSHVKIRNVPPFLVKNSQNYIGIFECFSKLDLFLHEGNLPVRACTGLTVSRNWSMKTPNTTCQRLLLTRDSSFHLSNTAMLVAKWNPGGIFKLLRARMGLLLVNFSYHPEKRWYFWGVRATCCCFGGFNATKKFIAAQSMHFLLYATKILNKKVSATAPPPHNMQTYPTSVEYLILRTR